MNRTELERRGWTNCIGCRYFYTVSDADICYFVSANICFLLFYLYPIDLMPNYISIYHLKQVDYEQVGLGKLEIGDKRSVKPSNEKVQKQKWCVNLTQSKSPRLH